MAAAELRGGDKPSLNEALTWIGFRVDDIYGAGVGSLEDVWIDPGTGTPRWLLVTEGRFDGRATLVPFGDATPGAGHVWVPYEREIVWQAPQVERGVPLTPQVEATLSNHYAANVAAAVTHRSPFAGRGEQGDGGGPGEPQQPPRATVRLASSPPAPWDVRSTQTPDPPVFPPPRLPHRPAPPVTAPPPGPSPEQPAPPRDEPAQPPQPPPSYGHWAPAEPSPPPPSGHQYEEQPSPQQAAQPPPQAWPPDPLVTLAGLPPGHQIEIEIEGNLTISGQLRGVKITPPAGG